VSCNGCPESSKEFPAHCVLNEGGIFCRKTLARDLSGKFKADVGGGEIIDILAREFVAAAMGWAWSL